MTLVDLCLMCRHPLPIDAPMRLCPACLIEGALCDDPSTTDDDTDSDVTDSFGSSSPYGRYLLPSTEFEPTLSYHPSRPFATQFGGQHDTALWSPSSSRSSGVVVVPNYQILGVLGRGGMGIVYQALQVAANRPVALKMIRADAHLHDEQLQRFSSEVRSVASLRHPNVVQIFEVGEVDGRPFFSLELLEGGTLKMRLASASMLPRVAAEMLLPIARAVAAAHQAGIVHRDLKPSNILFDLDGSPKVADFGLAKRLEADDGQTQTGQVVGTPCYMSPEQARGDNSAVGKPADVYSLGAILYEMLTGRPPFKEATTSETIQMVIGQDPIPPTRLQARLPRDLETICLKCLDKEPSRRYPHAGGLADDLQRYVNGEPIRARRTPAWERAAKWSRRKPTQAAGLSAGLVAMIALVFFSARSIEEGRRKEDENARRRLKASVQLENGRTEQARDDLSEARTIFKTLLADLEDEPLLADLTDRALDHLREVEARLQEATLRTWCLGLLADFRRKFDQALLLDGHTSMSPTSLSREAMALDNSEGTSSRVAVSDRGPALNLRRDPGLTLSLGLEAHPWLVRRAAMAALEVFGLRRDDQFIKLELLHQSFTREERDEIERGRYVMLMVLSEAVARPLPGENVRQQAQEALRLLDEATKHCPSNRSRRFTFVERLAWNASAIWKPHGLSKRRRPRRNRPTPSINSCSVSNARDEVTGTRRGGISRRRCVPEMTCSGPIAFWRSPS